MPSGAGTFRIDLHLCGLRVADKHKRVVASVDIENSVGGNVPTKHVYNAMFTTRVDGLGRKQNGLHDESLFRMWCL